MCAGFHRLLHVLGRLATSADHEPIEKFMLAMNLSTTGFMVLAQAINLRAGLPLE